MANFNESKTPAELPTHDRCLLVQHDVDRHVKVGAACDNHEVSRMTFWRWQQARKKKAADADTSGGHSPTARDGNGGRDASQDTRSKSA